MTRLARDAAALTAIAVAAVLAAVWLDDNNHTLTIAAAAAIAATLWVARDKIRQGA